MERTYKGYQIVGSVDGKYAVVFNGKRLSRHNTIKEAKDWISNVVSLAV